MKNYLKTHDSISISNSTPIYPVDVRFKKLLHCQHEAANQVYDNEDYLSDLVKVLKIKSLIVGVGGAGNNAISRLQDLGLTGTKTLNINTDAQDLYFCNSDNKILIGKESCKGMGSGNNPSLGAEAAKEDIKRLSQTLKSDIVFITCGLGGGTGTGAAPIIAREAKKNGALVVSFCSIPFSSEGAFKRMRAKLGLKYLSKYSDSVIPMINDNLLKLIPNVPMLTAFKVMDEVLVRSIREVVNLINNCGLVNIDFADVKKIFEREGDYPSGLIGITESLGEDADLIQKSRLALNNPLLQLNPHNVDNCLVSVSGNYDMQISKVNKIVSTISREIPRSANLKFGTNIDPSLNSKIRITVLGKGPISPYVKSAIDK